MTQLALGLDRPDQSAPGRTHAEPTKTELDAALSLVGKSGIDRVAYLEKLVDAGFHGLTDHEAAMQLDLPISSINGRRNELGSHVERSKRSRIGPYGKPNGVYVATERGRRWVNKQRREANRLSATPVEDPNGVVSLVDPIPPRSGRRHAPETGV